MKIDDDFLAELGLADLPAAERAAFKTHVYETLELRVGRTLAEGLSDAKLEEFESIIDHDLANVTRWLDANVPGFLDDPLFARTSQTLGEQASREDAICEYAATKWLDVHRPDHREVVKAVLEDIKDEIRQGAARVLHE